MNGRRVTALLLTAFLVAQALIRLQGGVSLPTASPDVWTEVAQGSYQAAQGSFLIPLGAGEVLIRTAGGTSAAAPRWKLHFSGIEIAGYGSGKGQLAVAATRKSIRVLPAYGSGYLLTDQRQNLWLVSRAGAHLLSGGGTGSQSRTDLQQHLQALQSSGRVPSGWRLTWAADATVVGQNIWFLSNRGRPLGAMGLDVWKLGSQGPILLSALSGLGITSLDGNGPAGVLAGDQQGDLLVINAKTAAVRMRLPGTDVLAAGQAGEALLVQAAPGRAPQLLLINGAQPLPHVLGLPGGAQALGPAAFSPDGSSLALLVQKDGKQFVYVTRVRGLGAGQSGDLLPPPGGTQIQSWATPSLASGRVYLVVRTGGTTETWERSVGDGQTAFTFRWRLG